MAVASRIWFFAALFFSLLSIPGLAVAQSPGSLPHQWYERTGLVFFQRHLDNLFTFQEKDKIQSLVIESGPTKPLVSSESPFLKIDWQSSLQSNYQYDPLQFPAPVFPFRPQKISNSDLRWFLATGFQLSLPAGFNLRMRTIVSSSGQLDPTARTKIYDQINASVEIPLATVNYQVNNLHIWLGRNWETWGPGWTGSAILDNQFPSPDGFGATYSGTNFDLRYRGGRLDDLTTEEINYHRYFFGHRLDFSPVSGLRIGLSETALVATDGAMPLWALNPILPWVMAEQEKRGSLEKTNIVWAIDSVWNPGPWSLYGQFTLDDYMIDSEDRDTYPDQLGIMLGLAHQHLVIGQSTKHRLGIEYTRLWSWIYVHRDPELVYQAWQHSMGHPSGCDSESITAFWSRSTNNSLSDLVFWGRYHQRGQVWLGTSLDPVGSPGLPYPVPPVNTWWQAGMNLEYSPHRRVTARLQIGWTDSTIKLVPDDLAYISHWHGSFSISFNMGQFRMNP